MWEAAAACLDVLQGVLFKFDTWIYFQLMHCNCEIIISKVHALKRANLFEAQWQMLYQHKVQIASRASDWKILFRDEDTDLTHLQACSQKR